MDSVDRCELPYTSFSQKYILPKKTFSQQFSHLYNRRLTKMKEQIRTRAALKWGGDIAIMNRIIDSEVGGGPSDSNDPEACDVENQDKDYVLIGTLYKQMQNRPSVLDEYKDSSAYHPANSIDSANISSEFDTLLLEDETGRISLTGQIIPVIGKFVTGVVIAVKGREKVLGEFEVSEWVFSSGGELQNYPITSDVMIADNEREDNENPKGPYVVFVSGLHFGSPNAPMLSMDLLVDFIAGRLGDIEDTEIAQKNCPCCYCWGFSSFRKRNNLDGWSN